MEDPGVITFFSVNSQWETNEGFQIIEFQGN
jgi:hypothetical protein